MKTMIAIQEGMAWWLGVTLPVVLGLTLLSWFIVSETRRASWRVQGRLMAGLLGAFGVVLGAPLVPWNALDSASAALGDAVPAIAGTRAVMPQSLDPHFQWLGLALALFGGLWVLGMLWAFGRLLAEQRRLGRLLKCSQECDGAALRDLLGDACGNALNRSGVRVWFCAEEISPCCLGLRPGNIVLPENFIRSLSLSDRRLVVHHEWQHLRRHDLVLLYFQRILEGIYWWNPMVSKVSARLDLAREGRCDEALVEGGEDPRAYAELLVRLGERFAVPGHRVMLSATPLFESLKARVERVLKSGKEERRCGSLMATGAAVMMLVVSAVGVALLVSMIGERWPARPASPGGADPRIAYHTEIDNLAWGLVGKEGNTTWIQGGTLFEELHPVPPILLRPSNGPAIGVRPAWPVIEDLQFSRRVLDSQLEELNRGYPKSGGHPYYFEGDRSGLVKE